MSLADPHLVVIVLVMFLMPFLMVVGIVPLSFLMSFDIAMFLMPVSVTVAANIPLVIGFSGLAFYGGMSVIFAAADRAQKQYTQN